MAPADPVQTELVTVMIPAYNEEQFIGRCLDSVRQQDYRNLQIVVVDGCSTDGTEEQVRARMAEDDRIELVSNPRRIIPVALNLAAQAARGRWLVRVDAHSSVEATYVSQAVARLSEGRWGGVGGRKDGVGQTTAGRAIAAALGSRFGVGNSMYHHGTTAQEVDHIPFGSYPVALIRELGGWDGRQRGPGLSWATDACSSLPVAHRAIGRLVLLFAFAPHAVDRADLVATGAGDRELVEIGAWASLTTARRIGTDLAHRSDLGRGEGGARPTT